MSIDELRAEAAKMTRWRQHRFLVMVGGVIVVSLVLVSIALGLYYTSGAWQVDVSRPAYKSIQKEASQNEKSTDVFSATGALNESAFEEFNAMYDRRASRVTDTNSFDPTPMTDESLQTFSVGTMNGSE